MVSPPSLYRLRSLVFFVLIWPFLHSLGGVYDENVFFASLIHIITKLGGLYYLFCRFFVKIGAGTHGRSALGSRF